MSKITKVKSAGRADGKRRRKPGGMKATRREVTGREVIGREDSKTSPNKRSMNTQPFVSEDRIAAARQRISEGFYDRDEVRRAIAEALVFVLGARRD